MHIRTEIQKNRIRVHSHFSTDSVVIEQSEFHHFRTNTSTHEYLIKTDFAVWNGFNNNYDSQNFKKIYFSLVEALKKGNELIIEQDRFHRSGVVITEINNDKP